MAVAEAHTMSLTRLFSGLSGPRLGPWRGVRVRQLVTDSRRAGAGALFFALPGERDHGLSHLREAVANGAVAAVVPAVAATGLVADLGTGAPHPLALYLAEDPAALLAPLSARFYGHPARRLVLCGVTGTNGKTTTALMLAAVLRAGEGRTAHWTTTEVRAGRSRFRPYWTTPPPPDLHRFLAAAVQARARLAVLEVSSHGVVLGRLDGLRFAAGAVTNLSPDHLDFHGSFAAYADAKRRFVHSLDADAVAALNGDDEAVRAFATGCRARVITYGASAGADLRLHAVTPRRRGRGYRARLAIGPADLRPGGEPVVELVVPLPGGHNVMNAAAALAVALARGADADAALRALARLRAPPRRLQVRRIGPFTVVNDVAMNEASYDTVLAWASQARAPQVVVVCALRGHRGPDTSGAVAGVLARHARRLGCEPVIVSVSREEVAHLAADHRVRDDEIRAFLARCRREDLRVEVCERLADAVERAVARLVPGGLLLLLGTFGMDAGPRLAEEALARRWDLPLGRPTTFLEPSFGVYADPGGRRRHRQVDGGPT
jgi:UDP-N-acetylmuramoyl-L-alanyl-D-glutamate--2,6-diaminopimelate ligase